MRAIRWTRKTIIATTAAAIFGCLVFAIRHELAEKIHWEAILLLKRAAVERSIWKMRLAILAGADPSALYAAPPVRLAVAGGHLAAVEFLVKAGADPLARGKDIDSAFFASANDDRTDILRYLLDVITTKDGSAGHRNDPSSAMTSALDGAIFRCQPEAVKILISYGAVPRREAAQSSITSPPENCPHAAELREMLQQFSKQ